MTDNDVVMVIDTSKCTACRSCQVACKQWHSLPAEDTTFTGEYTNPPDVSGANLTVVKFLEKEIAGKLRFLFFHERCRHCDTPLCKPACPKGAILKSPVGIVRIDPNLCIPLGTGACTTAPFTVLRPCQTACPYKTTDGAGMPRWQYNMGGVPQLSKMRKCDFCYNKLAEVGDGAFTDLNVPPFTPTPGVGPRTSTLPSCVVTCPAGAILINRLGAIKPIVIAQLNKLKASGYPNAIVYPYQWPKTMTHVNWILLEHPTVYGLSY